MLKSLFGSIVFGVIVGSVLYFIGTLKQRIPFDVTTWAAISGMTAIACFLLSWRDSHQQKKLVEGRELNELEVTTNPLVSIINSDPKFSFVPVFTAPPSELFDETWFINSKTLDCNFSAMAVKLKASAAENELHREINRIARAACGGLFLRTHLVGTLVYCPNPTEINIESLVSKSFGGRSGVLWTMLINENDRTVVSGKFDYPTRFDRVYETILSWFRDQGYQVKSELIRNWITRSRGKGKFGVFMELFNRRN